MDINKRYVVGFLFDTKRRFVLLIKKNKPKWMYGLYNGVGGLVEKNESLNEAMIREFTEETGLSILNWNPYCGLLRKISGTTESRSIECFWAVEDESVLFKAKTFIKKEVRVIPVVDLISGDLSVINDLPWLVTLALTEILSGNVCGYKVFFNQSFN